MGSAESAHTNGANGDPGSKTDWALLVGDSAISLTIAGGVALALKRDPDFFTNWSTPAMATLAAAALLYRLLVLRPQRNTRRTAPSPDGEQNLPLPFCVKSEAVGNRELIVVGTMHISPKSATDVHQAIDSTKPSRVLIELDAQRLERFKSSSEGNAEAAQPLLPPRGELQPLELDGVEVHATRASWNGAFAGSLIEGALLASSRTSANSSGADFLHVREYSAGQVCRDILEAKKAGAKGLVFTWPARSIKCPKRVEVQWGCAELRAAVCAGEWGLPPLPCLLLSPEDSAKVSDRLAQTNPEPPRIRFTVLNDNLPTTTLRKLLIRNTVLWLTGIPILYGVLRLANVKVGQEFAAADKAAQRHQVPCQCCDVSMDSLTARIREKIRPTPSNIFSTLKQWLSFPRAFLRVIFPRTYDLDFIGIFIVQLISLPLRYWLGLLVSASVSSFFISFVWIQLPGLAIAAAVTHANGGDKSAQQSGDTAFQTWPVVFLVYILPGLKSAILDDRDEAMYNGAVGAFVDNAAASNTTTGVGGDVPSERIVLVCGAAHGNGILQRVRERGLGAPEV